MRSSAPGRDRSRHTSVSAAAEAGTARHSISRCGCRRSRSTWRCPARRSPCACRPTAVADYAGRAAPVGPAARPDLVMTSLAVRAHAKINLDLRIVGAARRRLPRSADDLPVAGAARPPRVSHGSAGAFAIESADPDMPARRHQPGVAGGAGAVVGVGPRGPRCAASTWRSRSASRPQAGLGGGSSDAAATLVALNDLWSSRFDAGDLARLGGDARRGRPVLPALAARRSGLGRGELLYPLARRSLHGRAPRQTGVRRVHGGGVRLVRRQQPRRPSDDVQALAVPWYPGPLPVANDLEPVPSCGSARSCWRVRRPCCAAGPKWP